MFCEKNINCVFFYLLSQILHLSLLMMIETEPVSSNNNHQNVS